jgi:putative flippase GtrA
VPPTSPAPATPVAEEPRAGAIVGLYRRFSHLIREFGKFGAVGAVGYVTYLVIFNICLVRMAWFPSLVIATVISTTLAFVGNRFWTWRDRDRTALHREYILYFIFNVVGLLITAAVLWLSHEKLGAIWPSTFRTVLADNIAGNIIGVGLASVFRFWSYRRFVFKAVPAET